MLHMETERLATQLWILTLKRCSAEAAAWLAAFPQMASAQDFARAFDELGARLGDGSAVLTCAEARALEAAGADAAPSGWTLEDLGRSALLTSAFAELPRPDYLLLLARCASTERGRSAVMRALTLLPSACAVA